jgi:hypothetical protein
VAALGTAVGLVPVLAGTAVAADPAGEVIFQGVERTVPRDVHLSHAGATGHRHSQEGSPRNEWVDHATGRTHDAHVPSAPTDYGGYATVELRTGDVPDRAQITDLATGRVTTIPLPEGTRWTRAYTPDSILVGVWDAPTGTFTGLRQVRVVDGATVVREVDGLPASAERVTVVDQDGRGALLRVHMPHSTGHTLHLFDHATATLQALHSSSAGAYPRMNSDWITWVPTGATRFWTVPRANPAEAPSELKVPGGRITGSSPVGNWMIFRLRVEAGAGEPPLGLPLQAIPIRGGAVRTLLPRSIGGMVPTPQGDVLVPGGSDALHWAVWRVRADADGVPQVSSVREVPPVLLPVGTLALGGSRLNYVVPQGNGFTGVHEQDLAPLGPPAPAGSRKVRAWEVDGPRSAPIALGDGQSAYLAGGTVKSPRALRTHRMISLPREAAATALVSASGRYAVVDAADGKQYVADFQDSHGTSEVLTRPRPTAAALWGSTFYKPAAATGSVDAYDLKTRRTTPAVNTGSGCVPTSLQAVGRWLYWQCSTTRAGVFDLTAKKNITAPAGGRLGDGFVVTKNADGRLLLTDLLKGGTTTGFSAPGTAVGEWAVDAYGGHVAYTDPEQRIHLKPTGIARQATTVVESQADGTAVARKGADPWTARFLLSRPVARWTVAFTDTRGRTVATRTGTAREGAQIAPTWDGKDAKGNVVLGGRHTWTLSTDAGDGTGVRRIATGTLHLSGAKTPHRDYDGDGYGDVMTFTTGGTLHTHRLGLNGDDFSTQSGGWPRTSTFVPYGDLTGDRCNDVLVRDAHGALDRYDGSCTGAVRPTGPRTRLGTGYQQYNLLTSPGDFTGDGRPDLIARHRTTHHVFLLAAKADGKLAAPVRIRSNWKAYSHLIGAGDLNGDGHGDLLARGSNGELFRYDGTAKGQFKERVRVFTKWGNGYKEIVGVGDVSGDGHADLIVRDTAGGVFRNEGNGKGGFGARRALTTGWQGYRSMF